LEKHFLKRDDKGKLNQHSLKPMVGKTKLSLVTPDEISLR